MAAETAPAMAKSNPPPTLYLRDEQIEKYLGEAFDSLKMDETAELSFRCKVTGLSKRDEKEYNDKGDPTGKTKTHLSVDLELVERNKQKPINDGKAELQKGRTVK